METDRIRGATGVVYEERMADHKCLWDSGHNERPERFVWILQRCRELGLIDRCFELKPRRATDKELLSLHSPDMISILQRTENSSDERTLEELSSHYDFIYIHPTSYELALLAAGSTIDLVDAILERRIQNGMAIIRPPGHHAMKSEYCGYCFYNNVALAAKNALDNKGLSRILIVDWDVHHGQATQQMFYDDPRVVYFSIHRYEKGTSWPCLRESDYHYIGSGKGRGFNVNVPLNEIKMGNADYMAIFQQLLLPIAYEFQPELVIVSAGYDAALGCPEGEMEVTPAFYAHLTTSLLGLANGRMAVVLEGGYCLKSLAEGAALTLRTLLGDPCPAVGHLGPPSQSIQEMILNCIYVLRPFWNNLQFQESFVPASSGLVEENQFLPRIEFLGKEEKLERYPTRGICPTQDPEVTRQLDLRLDALINETRLVIPRHRVCFAYDKVMTKHRKPGQEYHVERPERITVAYQTMEQMGILKRCLPVETRKATREEMLFAHTEELVSMLESLPTLDNFQIDELNVKLKDHQVYVCPDSWNAAAVSLGSTLQVVDRVLDGHSRSGFVINRPPGHHAGPNSSSGFCLLNNTAIAAKHAVEKRGLKRVLIVDWDIHHGDGIQEVFKNDPRVLYVSIHRGDCFPVTNEKSAEFVGLAEGAGFSVNIRWPVVGAGDSDYLAAFSQVILPIAYQFNPELVLVATGFDSARGDPLGCCDVTPEGYGQMTHLLTPLAEGRVVMVLEGGYNVEAVAKSYAMCAKALLGDPLPSPELSKPVRKFAAAAIKETIRAHKRYWSSLAFDVQLPETNVLIPPWIDDPAIHSANPQLLNLTAAMERRKSELDKVAKQLKSAECPHVGNIVEDVDFDSLSHACAFCVVVDDTWVCLSCLMVVCGEKSKNDHSLMHLHNTKHCLYRSRAKANNDVWCCQCRKRITDMEL